jgi:hypothetical protein
MYDLLGQAGTSPAGVDDALGGRPEERASLNAALALHQQVVRLRRFHAAAEGTSINAMPVLESVPKRCGVMLYSLLEAVPRITRARRK